MSSTQSCFEKNLETRWIKYKYNLVRGIRNDFDSTEPVAGRPRMKTVPVQVSYKADSRGDGVLQAEDEREISQDKTHHLITSVVELQELFNGSTSLPQLACPGQFSGVQNGVMWPARHHHASSVPCSIVGGRRLSRGKEHGNVTKTDSHVCGRLLVSSKWWSVLPRQKFGPRRIVGRNASVQQDTFPGSQAVQSNRVKDEARDRCS